MVNRPSYAFPRWYHLFSKVKGEEVEHDALLISYFNCAELRFRMGEQYATVGKRGAIISVMVKSRQFQLHICLSYFNCIISSS